MIPVVTMLLAGVGIPVMAAINSTLGVKIGNPIAAAFVLLLVASVVVGGVLAVAGAPSRAAWSGLAPQHFSGGIFVAFYVLTITWAAPRIGLGNAIFLVLMGQLACAAVIDHFALLGVAETPITGKRVAGLLLMAVGVLLASREF